MGKSLKEALTERNMKRKDIVVSTKIFKCGSGPNDEGQGRKHIIEGLQASLERMEMD